MQLFFTARGDTYEEAVSNGMQNLYMFQSLVLLENGFREEDLKTSNFSVSEDVFFDEEKKEFVTRGYLFNQSAVLSTDYDNDLQLIASQLTDDEKYKLIINDDTVVNTIFEKYKTIRGMSEKKIRKLQDI